MTERRKFQRASISLPVKISLDEFDVVTETKNISGNGALCLTDKFVEPMTKLDVLLLIPHKQKNGKVVVRKVHCQGVVVRSEHLQTNGTKRYFLGVFFNNISEHDRTVLLEYIQEHHLTNPAA